MEHLNESNGILAALATALGGGGMAGIWRALNRRQNDAAETLASHKTAIRQLQDDRKADRTLIMEARDTAKSVETKVDAWGEHSKRNAEGIAEILRRVGNGQ